MKASDHHDILYIIHNWHWFFYHTILPWGKDIIALNNLSVWIRDWSDTVYWLINEVQIPDTLVLYFDRTHACKDLRPCGKPHNFALLPERHMQLTWVRCHWQSAWEGVQKMKHAHLSCALAVFSVLGSLDVVWWYTSSASRPGIVFVLCTCVCLPSQ